MNWIEIASPQELGNDDTKTANVAGRGVGLHRIDDRFFAMNNLMGHSEFLGFKEGEASKSVQEALRSSYTDISVVKVDADHEVSAHNPMSEASICSIPQCDQGVMEICLAEKTA